MGIYEKKIKKDITIENYILYKHNDLLEEDISKVNLHFSECIEIHKYVLIISVRPGKETMGYFHCYWQIGCYSHHVTLQ